MHVHVYQIITPQNTHFAQLLQLYISLSFWSLGSIVHRTDIGILSIETYAEQHHRISRSICNVSVSREVSSKSSWPTHLRYLALNRACELFGALAQRRRQECNFFRTQTRHQ